MKKIVLGMLGLLVFGIVAGYGIGWFFTRSQPVTDRIPIAVEPELPPREVQLYFADVQGQYLVPELRQIPGCDADQACMRSLIEALAQGSELGGLPVLPKGTRLLNVELENDLVRLNFSRQMVDQLPAGSLSELLAVYALANSLVENFSYLRQIQILIEGEILQTLKGHVRIDQPIFADFTYSHSPLPGAFPENESSEGKPASGAEGKAGMRHE